MVAAEDIWSAMAGGTVEATDRFTTAVIIETSKLVITTISISNSQILEVCRLIYVVARQLNVAVGSQ